MNRTWNLSLWVIFNCYKNQTNKKKKKKKKKNFSLARNNHLRWSNFTIKDWTVHSSIFPSFFLHKKKKKKKKSSQNVQTLGLKNVKRYDLCLLYTRPYCTNPSFIEIIWATAWQNQHVRPAKTGICTAKTGIRPVCSVFAVRMKEGWILKYPLSAQQRLCSDFADAQADLCLQNSKHSFTSLIKKTFIILIKSVMVGKHSS